MVMQITTNPARPRTVTADERERILQALADRMVLVSGNSSLPSMVMTNMERDVSEATIVAVDNYESERGDPVQVYVVIWAKGPELVTILEKRHDGELVVIGDTSLRHS